MNTSCGFYYNDINVTPYINIINRATLPVKSSHYEQHAVICFLWAKKRFNTNKIHSDMHPVNKCFAKPIWMVYQKFASDTEVQSVVHQWL